MLEASEIAGLGDQAMGSQRRPWRTDSYEDESMGLIGLPTLNQRRWGRTHDLFSGSRMRLSGRLECALPELQTEHAPKKLFVVLAAFKMLSQDATQALRSVIVASA